MSRADHLIFAATFALAAASFAWRFRRDRAARRAIFARHPAVVAHYPVITARLQLLKLIVTGALAIISTVAVAAHALAAVTG